jgi:hypothetical protein
MLLSLLFQVSVFHCIVVATYRWYQTLPGHIQLL